MEYLDTYYRLLPSFSKTYDFKICGLEDLDKVLDFFKKHWKADHAFLKSRELLDWQEFDVKNQRYNFALAIHKKTGEIHALEGFILTSQFDPNIKKPMRWPAIWANRENVGRPGLGLMVHWFAIDTIPTPYYGVLGISEIAYPIYQKMDVTGTTKQWYILNTQKPSYSLVANYEGAPKTNITAGVTNGRFISLSIDDYLKLTGDIFERVPEYKSKMYYVNRYLKHPIYTYFATMIVNEGAEKGDAIFFWRICEHNSAKCIRIVDYFGDYAAMEGNLNNFLNMLFEEDAEFIDFINEGIDKIHFEKAGFVDRAKTDIILSNYFEPYHLKNVDYQYAFNSFDGNAYCPLFFKGDSDQDRPGVI